MFGIMEATRLESLHVAQDPATGLQAIIALHSTRLGPALGGCRYLTYSDSHSAVADAARLAQSMSYKAALAGLPFGGGKAVILRPAHVPNRGALFEAFGRFIETLNGRYITAVDSGTKSEDMDCIAQYTQHVTSTRSAGDPSPHTAMGVFAGIRASAMARLGSDDLQGLRIAVQGLGQVGYALAEQLAAAGAELLVSDLEEMVGNWKPNVADNYRATLEAEPAETGLRKMLFGMGSLSLGELAGERMKVSLEANSPEDEQDCFSDNTHNSHFYDAKGIRNVYLGEYTRVDGTKMTGASLSSLVAKADPAADSALKADLAATEAKIQVMVDHANKGEHYDQLIAAGNTAGNQIVRDAIASLVKQTGSIEAAAGKLGISDLNPDNADHEF